MAIETRQYLGVDNILWGINIPQAPSTWPNPREAIEKCLAGVPQDEKDQMLWGTAAKLYKLA
jgi:predicted TIM-barrel fold metal-dependent hydrolase